jgi:hypothetical protein
VNFRHHLIDEDLPKGLYAQTALVDLDNDGKLEYITEQQYGDIFWYKMHTPANWTRHLLGRNSPSDMGGVGLDVDGRGVEWREHVILDVNLGGHAAVVGDVTGNGLPDIIAKPWNPRPDNAAGGRMFVVFLENLGLP